MHVYKSIEKSSYVLGLPMQELGLLICLFMSAVMGGSLASVVMRVSFWFYLLSLLLVVGLYLLLRRAAKKDHPSFLMSWISYHFFQPNQIEP